MENSTELKSIESQEGDIFGTILGAAVGGLATSIGSKLIPGIG